MGARENQLVNLAVELAEKQLREGTATSQVMTHYLKLGTERESLERERLRSENQLLQARVQSLQDQARAAVTHEEVIRALKVYQGLEDAEDPYAS